jgi:antitoxin HicB
MRVPEFSGQQRGRRRRKMATHSYTVLVEKEDGGYRAHCPALPGCRSFGETKKEAVNNIKFSISYRLERLMAKGKPIPKDGDLACPEQGNA